jgi:hypothetical protein
VTSCARPTPAPRRAPRAALYRVAALIPGVQLLGIVRDHSGRRGLGVAFTSHGFVNELIFNPRTAALLGERGIGKAPGSSSWAVYIDSRVVARVPYPSPRPLTPACHHDAGHVRNVPGGVVVTGQGRGSSRAGPAAPAPTRLVYEYSLISLIEM